MEEQNINYAIDPQISLFDPGQSLAEVETTQETEVQEPQVEVQETTPQADVPNTFEIEGIGSVNPDEIKEWRNGYLRQSDYTKKTQELAEQRKESEVAMEFYKYMQSNPHLVEGLRRIQQGMFVPQEVQNSQQYLQNPVLSEVDKLKSQLAQYELNQTISTLKSKYADFNEVEVMNEAQQRGLSDLEFVYKAMKSENTPDVTALTAQIRAEIMKELETNKQATSTIIKGEGVQKTNTITLSPQQMRIAQNLGLSPEEYAKWM